MTGRGLRVYEIREALGSRKRPLSQAKFAARLTEASGGRKRYDGPMIARMENGKRRVTDQDAEWLALLDPMGRGPVWILGWEEADAEQYATTLPRPEPGPVDPAAPKVPQ